MFIIIPISEYFTIHKMVHIITGDWPHIARPKTASGLLLENDQIGWSQIKFCLPI